MAAEFGALGSTRATPVRPTENYPSDYPDSVKADLMSFLNYTGPFSGNVKVDIRNPIYWMQITNGSNPCKYFQDTWQNASEFFNCSTDVASTVVSVASVMSTATQGNGSTNGTDTAATYDVGLTAVFSLLAAVVSLVTILGNLLVLVAFFVDRSIRQPSNYFIASLAVSDCILGLSSMPLYTMYELLGYWPLGQWICDLWLSLDYTVCLTSQYTVFFITLDRFCSVRIPAKYRNWRTEKKILIMVAITWILPTLVFFISIIGWQFFVGVRTVPEDKCYVQFASNPIFNTVLVIVYYWITLFIMCGLYTTIYRVAWNLQRKSEEKHKKMTSIVNMGNAMTKIGMGMANNAEEKKKSEKVSKPPLKVSKKYSTTSFQSSREKDDASSVVYASDSDSNSPKHSPSYKKHSFRIATREEPPKSSTLMVPVVHITSSNGIEQAPTYNKVINNNINGVAHKEHDHGQDERDCLTFVRTASLRSSNSDNPDVSDPPTPDSPVWKKRIKFPSDEQNNDEISGEGTKPVFDTVSEHTNGKTVTKVVARSERKARLGFSGVVQRLSFPKLLKRNNKEKVKKSKSENRARKALKTITLILGAFVLFWTPYHIVVLIYGFCESCRESKLINLVYSITYWLCYCNSPLNPFCYAAANQNFKKTFTRILKGDFRRR